MREIVQIVPLLPPPFEGLGGHALALGQAVASSHGIRSRYVVGSPSWCGTINGTTQAVRERSAVGLAEVLAGWSTATGDNSVAATVLLHYVNYGYQRRGCPAWLVEGLTRWRQEAPSRRLVTVFHEVYAFGPPWRSSFWLSPIQRHLAARLARLSDGIVTSLESYARALRRWRPDLPACVLPVFSTVGEPAAVADIADRDPILVTFGGPGSRARVHDSYGAELTRTCRALRIETVVDIGPTIPSLPSNIDGRQVRPLGVLPPEEISMWLQRARAGFLAYPPSLLSKSTIFAAYAAHGAVPICAWSTREVGGDPCANKHFLPATDRGLALSPFCLQGVATSARDWYRGHALAVHAAWVQEVLGE